jgi:CBS domain-containing protein
LGIAVERRLLMKVREVMTKQATFCYPDTSLSGAAELMWNGKCGFLPVRGEGGNIIGVITDRDISIALGTRNRRPSEVLVKDVMPGRLFTCTADDSVACALTTMRIEGLRRLPVVDREGALMGVLSIDDLVLKARENAIGKDVSYKDVEDTYKAINGHASRIVKVGSVAA